MKASERKNGRRRVARDAAPALTAAEKSRLLKPLTNYGELIEELVQAWQGQAREIRVPGLSPAKLRARLLAAQRASEREVALRRKLEAKLQPAADARLLAEHAAWKGALDVYAIVKAAARTNPAIAAPFESFAKALARRRHGESNGGSGDEEPQG
jgi:hypothetical protein